MKTIDLNGVYTERGYRYANRLWKQICADHQQEFPVILECEPGTFNVLLDTNYNPPADAEYRELAVTRGRTVGRYGDGNHISPRAIVIQINNTPVTAWIYRGGHREKPVLELISKEHLASLLGLSNGDHLELTIGEYDEGEEGLPRRPPPIPGETII